MLLKRYEYIDGGFNFLHPEPPEKITVGYENKRGYKCGPDCVFHT